MQHFVYCRRILAVTSRGCRWSARKICRVRFVQASYIRHRTRTIITRETQLGGVHDNVREQCELVFKAYPSKSFCRIRGTNNAIIALSFCKRADGDADPAVETESRASVLSDSIALNRRMCNLRFDVTPIVVAPSCCRRPALLVRRHCSREGRDGY